MTDANATSKSRTVSLILWISGAALWALVGVLFFMTYMRGEKRSASPGPATALSSLEMSEAQVSGGERSESVWNPDGIADFSFTERSGEAVTKKDLLGKPWIVGFVFSRCAGPCPKVSGQMALLQKHFADDEIRLVTMTVDPDYDSPEVLSRYATAFGADPEKWLFLTGDKEKVHDYILKEFLQTVEEMTGEDRQPGFEVLHTTNLLLVDAQGVVRGKYNALFPEEMAKLKKDAKDLLDESLSAAGEQ